MKELLPLIFCQTTKGKIKVHAYSSLRWELVKERCCKCGEIYEKATRVFFDADIEFSNGTVKDIKEFYLRDKDYQECPDCEVKVFYQLDKMLERELKRMLDSESGHGQ